MKDFVPNFAGFVKIRNLPSVVADLERRAHGIAAMAGDGMIVMPAETDYNYPKGRARVAVVTGTAQAAYHEARDAALTRAIDGGR